MLADIKWRLKLILNIKFHLKIFLNRKKKVHSCFKFELPRRRRLDVFVYVPVHTDDYLPRSLSASGFGLPYDGCLLPQHRLWHKCPLEVIRTRAVWQKKISHDGQYNFLHYILASCSSTASTVREFIYWRRFSSFCFFTYDKLFCQYEAKVIFYSYPVCREPCYERGAIFFSPLLIISLSAARPSFWWVKCSFS